MKIKDYKRTYRPIYTGKKKEKTVNPDLVDFKEDGPQSLLEYVETTKKFMWEAELAYFDGLLKYEWMRTRLIYNGLILESTLGAKRHDYDIAVGHIFKSKIGFDSGGIFYSRGWMRGIVSYIYEFFPDFKYHSPFDVKYAYPFEYMNLECLFLVGKMDERMELLKIGEAKGMLYAEFMDYVINYYKCLNEELDTDKYDFVISHYTLPYVKKVK